MKIARTIMAIAASTFLTAGAAIAATDNMQNGMMDQGMDKPAMAQEARPMRGRSMSHHKMMMMKKHHMMMKHHHMMHKKMMMHKEM
jgi:hypothetical protein